MKEIIYVYTTPTYKFRVPISKEEAESRNLHYIEDGFNKCYYTILKDPSQLDKVFKYYDKK